MTKLSKELLKELGLIDQRKAGLGCATKPVPEGLSRAKGGGLVP